MNIEAYLNRINYKEDVTTSLAALQKLQKAHLLHVPFENLDIHYQIEISLNTDKFYQKVVEQGRGGFCYELNGLFHTFLTQLGYNSKIISARVFHSEKKEFGKEFDHLAIIVELNQFEYLVDVGFGEFTFQPLKLELGTIQKDPRGSYIIEKYDSEYFVVSKLVGEAKVPQYIFKKQERQLSDFKEMCNYHQTDPASSFTQKKLISKPTEDGRITITGNSLKISKGEKTMENIDFEADEFESYVLDWFDVEVLNS